MLDCLLVLSAVGISCFLHGTGARKAGRQLWHGEQLVRSCKTLLHPGEYPAVAGRTKASTEAEHGRLLSCITPVLTPSRLNPAHAWLVCMISPAPVSRWLWHYSSALPSFAVLFAIDVPYVHGSPSRGIVPQTDHGSLIPCWEPG